MTATTSLPSITPTDRLGLTLFLATVIHGMVILGVGFGMDLGAKPKAPPALDIILVQTQSDTPPQDAKYLAQANQQASGSQDEGHPSSPFTSPNPLPGAGSAPAEARAASPRQPDTAQVQALTVQQSTVSLPTQQDTAVETPQKANTDQTLVDRSLEIARLVAEISVREERYAKRPRVHYIDAAGAKSAVEASYIESWVAKVEQIGTLNYPDEALRRRLNGKLILNVLLSRDGRVLQTEIAESSGHKLLDDAAVRIVKLASPFAPFPLEMVKTYDQLLITRTWIFSSDTGSLISGQAPRY